jgi:hypothetical protein
MNDLVTVIALWLSTAFGLPEMEQAPIIRYLPPATLADIRYHGQAADGGPEVIALYDDKTGGILLSDGWSVDDIGNVSVLVHELVHHLQSQTSKVYACPSEREALAYEAQERWLELFGRSLESEFGLDDISVKMMSTCLPH